MMGLGGAGMSALAKLLKGNGNYVTGCDLQESHYELGDIKFSLGHSIEHLKDNYDVLICSSAINKNNPEVLYAKSQNIKIISRAEALSELFNSKSGIGIAGTHGKTTTTSMTSLIFLRAMKNPTLYIGANVPDIGSNAIHGTGNDFIAELDESDGSFELFHPEITIITNVDWDHVDHYKTRNDVIKAFIRFSNGIKQNGTLIICAEDEGANKVFESCKSELKNHAKIIRYGFGNSFEWGAYDIKNKSGIGTISKISHNGNEIGFLDLNIPGEHNILNSLAAIAAAYERGIDFKTSSEILKTFHGSERRIQIKGEKNNILVIDDYAHHPTEMKASLNAIKSTYPDKKIVLIFQPHRFSRTSQFTNEIAQALSIADESFILPIYAASEENITGITSEKIAELNPKIHFVEFENALEVLKNTLKENNILITMGAGNVYELGENFLKNT